MNKGWDTQGGISFLLINTISQIERANFSGHPLAYDDNVDRRWTSHVQYKQDLYSPIQRGLNTESTSQCDSFIMSKICGQCSADPYAQNISRESRIISINKDRVFFGRRTPLIARGGCGVDSRSALLKGGLARARGSFGNSSPIGSTPAANAS